MMFQNFCLHILLAVICIPGCSQQPSSEQASQMLCEFLDQSMHEFVHERGTTENRWEGPFITRELLLMVTAEFARMSAYMKGFSDARQTIKAHGFKEVERLLSTPPKLGLFRSLWLPIIPEGSYKFEVMEFNDEGNNQRIKVKFIMTEDNAEYPDQYATYSLKFEDDSWRIDNVVGNNGFNLREYLSRKNFVD